jgi:hypothetical protein
MPRRQWIDFVFGNTPLSAARMTSMEDDLEAALVQLARDPSQLFSGAVTRDANGAATSASVTWPDGVSGIYSGTVSADFPGAVDAYTVTRAGSPTVTFTQPAVTRNAAGQVTNRPPITVS